MAVDGCQCSQGEESCPAQAVLNSAHQRSRSADQRRPRSPDQQTALEPSSPPRRSVNQLQPPVRASGGGGTAAATAAAQRAAALDGTARVERDGVPGVRTDAGGLAARGWPG